MAIRKTTAVTAAEIRDKLKPNLSVPPAAETVELGMVDTDDLQIDAAYQRRISQSGASKIRKMVETFSWSRFGAITVARGEAGQLSVVDGQHRLVAAQVLKIDQVPAVVVARETAEQAGDFVGINTVRSSVASIDKFRARVTSGDPVAVEVLKMLDELGISPDVPAGAGLRQNETRAVMTLEKMTKAFGYGVVFTALETLQDCQAGTDNLLTRFNIEVTTRAVAKMLDANRSLDRLDATLRDLDLETLQGEAASLVKMQGGQLAIRGMEMLLHRVNKRLREKIA